MLGTLSIFLCIFLALYVLLGKISQSDRFLIKEVEITGNKIIKKAEIFNIVKEDLHGRYLSMFPRNNFILYPKGKIEKKIRDKFLRLEDISIENKDIFKLVVSLKERDPNFVWCPQKDSDCFYLDKNGLVFDHAPNFSEGVFLKFQGGLMAKEKAVDYLGKNLIETGKLNEIIKFKSETEGIVKKQLGREWFASSITIMESNDFSILFSGKDDKSWTLLFVGDGTDSLSGVIPTDGGVLKVEQESKDLSLETNLINMARNLEVVVASEAFRVNLDKPNSNIDYIDLRFGKKVFYRFIY